MKKTLIALAVLATSGASFAQVTLTGNVGFGFQKSASQIKSNANIGSGMTTVDGTINFTANEDLGGGMRVIASTEVQLRGRNDDAPAATTNGNAFRPRNSTLAMITPVGVLSMGSIESPSGFFRTASYSDNWQDGMDSANGPWDAKANIDFVRFMVPVGPFQLSAWYTEVGAGIGNSAVVAANGTKVTAPVLMATYAAGPITAYADYTNFTAIRAASPVPLTVPVIIDGVDRYRIGADYNFGIAKVGFGYQTRNKGFADQYAVGVVVPLGAFTVNLTYGARDATTLGTTGDAAGQAVINPGYLTATNNKAPERTGTALQVRYNFSKTVLAEVNYATYTGGGRVGVGSPGNAASTDFSDEYRIRLNKSF